MTDIDRCLTLIEDRVAKSPTTSEYACSMKIKEHVVKCEKHFIGSVVAGYSYGQWFIDDEPIEYDKLREALKHA
jgi:hypothetical protein